MVLTFKQICKKNGTDKGDHIINKKGETYADIYDKYFTPLRNDDLNILELGVKTGRSIKALREYFPNAKIYGIDVDPGCKKYHDPDNNTFIEIVSQTDEAGLNSFLKDLKFDIIIDDASHVNKFTITSYNILNKRIKSGGLYIIEDLGCAYFKLEDEWKISENWPGMRFNDTPNSDFNNNIGEIHNFTNKIVEKLDNGENIREVYSLSDISYIHRYKYIMIIAKN
jgi:hypothetical protein